MSKKMLAFILAISVVSSTAVAQECDPESAKATIDNKYASRIASTTGMCDNAQLQIEMLNYAKTAYRACLRGKSLNDVLTELDRVIGLAKQQQRDVGCS